MKCSSFLLRFLSYNLSFSFLRYLTVTRSLAFFSDKFRSVCQSRTIRLPTLFLFKRHYGRNLISDTYNEICIDFGERDEAGYLSILSSLFSDFFLQIITFYSSFDCL